MKRLFILFSPAILLGGCVSVPYDTDSAIYAGYPTTVTAHATDSYYYDTHRVYPYGHPYHAPPYSRPYPHHPNPHYQPPAYTPPAPIIVPPTMEFHYKRHAQPGWQHRPQPHHHQFRNGPQREWHPHGQPHSSWEYRHDGHPEWQRRSWEQKNREHKDWGRRDYGPAYRQRDGFHRR